MSTIFDDLPKAQPVTNGDFNGFFDDLPKTSSAVTEDESQASPTVKTSTAGAFGRGAATNVLPAFGARGGAAAGEAAGGALAGAWRGLAGGEAIGGGPEDPLADVLGVGGAIVGAIIGGITANKAQDVALRKIAPDAYKTLQQYQQADLQQHPLASTFGSLAGSLPAFKLQNPIQTAKSAAALIKIAKGTATTPVEKQLAKNFAIQLGFGTGLGVVNPLLQGQKPTAGDITQNIAQMILFGEPRKYGRARLPENVLPVQPQPTEVENATPEIQIQKSVPSELARVDEVGQAPTETSTGHSVSSPEGEQVQLPPEGTQPAPQEESVNQTIQRVSAMSPDEFYEFGRSQKPNMTTASWNLGAKVSTPEEYQSLIQARDAAAAERDTVGRKALQEPTDENMNVAAKLATKSQFFNEALQKVPDSLKPSASQPTRPASEIPIKQPLESKVTPSPAVASQEPSQAAIRTPEGKIFTGNSHDQIYAQLGLKRKESDRWSGKEGFVLPSGEFITREQAKSDYGKSDSHEFDFGKSAAVTYLQAESLGYRNRVSFIKDFVKNRKGEVGEDEDEFLKRRYCSGTIPQVKMKIAE